MVEIKGPIIFDRAGGTSCLSIATGREESEIVCSYENGMIASYDIITQRCMKSWQLTVSDVLSVGATYNETTKLYNAVMNNKEIIQWSHDNTEISEFTVTKVQYPVHSLLIPPVATPTACPIVMYKNGHIELFTSSNKRQKQKGTQNMNVVQALCCHDNDMCHVIVMCYISSYSYCYVNYQLLNDEFIELNITDIHTQSLGEIIAMETAGSFLLTSWAKGMIVKTKIGQSPSVDDAIALGNNDIIIDVAVVNKDYYVILTKSNELKLYSIIYNTLQASLPITASLKITCCHGYILALLPAGFHGYPVSCTESFTLSSAIGKGKMTQPLTYQLFDSGCKKKSLKKKNITEDKLINACCNDPSLWTTANVLTKLTSIVEMLLNDNDKWHHNELKSIIEANVFPINYIPTLIQQCLSHFDWALIVTTLRNVDTIPEEALIDLLMAALDRYDDEAFLFIKEEQIITKHDLLCLLLSFVQNDSLMQQPLTKLSNDHIMILLNFLAEKSDEHILFAPPDSVLSYENILDWFGLILDTHFTSLILVPSIKPLLIDLHQRISTHLSFLSHLEVIGQIKTTSTQLKRQQTKQWHYKLDTLNFSI